MDPNVTLRELRSLAKIIDHNVKGGYVREDDLANASTNLAQRFMALDEWLTSNGLLPSEWQHARDLQDTERAIKEALALANSHSDIPAPTHPDILDPQEVIKTTRCVNCGAVVMTTTVICGRCNSDPHAKDDTLNPG